MALTKRLSADLKLYFGTVNSTNFFAGKRGVNLTVTRDMIDVTSQTTPTSTLERTFLPGLKGASMEFDGIHIVPNTAGSTPSYPRSAINIAEDIKLRSPIAAILQIYPGTAGAGYSDSETIMMNGYLKNVKESAGSLGDAATFSATFQITGDVTIMDGNGMPLY